MLVKELVARLLECDQEAHAVTVTSGGKVHKSIVQVEEPAHNNQVVLVSYKVEHPEVPWE